MKNQTLYFRNQDSETCHDLDFHLEEAREEGLQEIELFEAIPDKDKSYFWCKSFSEVCGIGPDFEPCGKSCEDYAPRNGKSGICKHKTHCYTHGNTVNFNVKTGKNKP